MFGLDPRDTISLIEPPVTIFVNPVAGVATKLVDPDPDRFWILFHASPGTNMFVAPTGLAAANHGICIGMSSEQPVIFTTELDGGVVSLGWEVFVAAGGNPVTVMTQSLRRSPELYGFTDVFKRPDASNHVPPVPARLPRRRPMPAGRIPPGVLAALGRRCPRLLGGQ